MDAARPNAGPDAIRLLMADHEDIDSRFERYRRLREFADADIDTFEERLAVARQICAMLVVHASIEEELFYPAARRVLTEQFLVDEAVVEHASVKELIRQIRSSDPAQPLFDARVAVLGQYVRHHLREEENLVFPRIRRTGLDLIALGRRMRERKQALVVETTLLEEGELRV